MVGDSAYKKGDTRPDGLEPIDPSNSDRIFAENLGVPFAEANYFFQWMEYGIRRMDKAQDVEAYLTQWKNHQPQRQKSLQLKNQ
jgi:hypothetical protein